MPRDVQSEPNWAVISNNCWGAGIYQDLKIRYNTPFIGMFLVAPDYIALLQDFRRLMAMPLEITQSRFGAQKYPVGVLGKVEIHFLHYASEAEAITKWTARTARLPKDDNELFIKICDRDGFQEQHLPAFDDLPFRNKVGFMKKDRYPVSQYHWAVEVESEDKTVQSGDVLWRATRDCAGFNARTWLGISQAPA
jgi:uncharacterized protein (DUF1919 family)